MNMQRERPPFSTISGTMVQLSARDMVAIYRWDDQSWVAHFRDGRGELSHAATWYRANAAWLRACHVGSVATLEAITMLTPEMIDKIGHLHRQAEAKGASRAASSMAEIAAFGRACGEIAARLHGWSVRLIDRVH